MPLLITADEAVSKKQVALLDRPVTIGRHPDCEVVIDDNSVSRRHARLSCEEGHFYLEDLDSRNGTEVNGSQIRGKTRLFDGAEIGICDVRFRFHMEDSSSDKPLTTRIDSAASRLKTSFFFAEEADRLDSSRIVSQVELSSAKTLKDSAGDLKEKLKALSAITLSLSTAWEQDDILLRVLDTLFELFSDSDRGFVVLVDNAGAITPHQMKTRRPQDTERVRISRTIIRTVLDSKQAVLSADAANDERFDLSQSVVDFKIRSVMCAPLVDADDHPIGAIQLDTLRSTVAYDQDDLEVLATVAIQASLALQKLELFRQAEENRQLEQDLRLAQEVQLRFLPQAEPQVPGYSFFSHYRPATQVGGDYFDYIRLTEHQWVVVVADVVGHGVAAALLMAKIAADARFACALNHDDPVKALDQINRSLNGLNMDRFVTLILGYLDSSKHEMTFANAGHLPPLVRETSGKTHWVKQARRSLPLGVSDAAVFFSETISLKPGDNVLLFTDGLSDLMNPQGDQFGMERLAREVELSPNRAPESIGKAICQAAKSHLGAAVQHDDICLVVFGRIQ
jgi:serine phosphatase RsbU (regulator of sigma subunit)/pSer/pThr/pTyr-binding forkhead associated (FHA) protein